MTWGGSYVCLKQYPECGNRRTSPLCPLSRMTRPDGNNLGHGVGFYGWRRTLSQISTSPSSGETVGFRFSLSHIFISSAIWSSRSLSFLFVPIVVRICSRETDNRVSSSVGRSRGCNDGGNDTRLVLSDIVNAGERECGRDRSRRGVVQNGPSNMRLYTSSALAQESDKSEPISRFTTDSELSANGGLSERSRCSRLGCG